jgi:metal-responsive CopG/Arc/MetJ family transcriptional regulator
MSKPRKNTPAPGERCQQISVSLPQRLIDALNALPKRTKSQFVRSAIEDKLSGEVEQALEFYRTVKGDIVEDKPSTD